MSKYSKLWQYVKNMPEEEIKITFEEAQKILGFPIDHSFLNYKKEAELYGCFVKKISIKNQNVLFAKKEINYGDIK